jgi:hypothetical protein
MLLVLVVPSSGCGDSSSSAPETASTSTTAAASVRDESVQDTSSSEQPDNESLREAAAEFWAAFFSGDSSQAGARATERCRDLVSRQAKAAPAAIEGAPQSELDKAGRATEYRVRGLTDTYGEVARVGRSSWEPWRYEDGRWKSDGCEGGSGPPAEAQSTEIDRQASVDAGDLTVGAASVRYGTEQYGSRPWLRISVEVANNGTDWLEATTLKQHVTFAVSETAAIEDVTGSGQACLATDDVRPYGLWCSQNGAITAPSDTRDIEAGTTGVVTFDGPDPSSTHDPNDLLVLVDGTPIELEQGS